MVSQAVAGTAQADILLVSILSWSLIQKRGKSKGSGNKRTGWADIRNNALLQSVLVTARRSHFVVAHHAFDNYAVLKRLVMNDCLVLAGIARGRGTTCESRSRNCRNRGDEREERGAHG